MQAPIETWAELAGSWYRGKLAPTGSSWRRWAAPDDFRPWEFELCRHSVLFALQCDFRQVYFLENLT